MKRLTDLPAGEEAPRLLNMIVEVPKDSVNKYEYDPELGVFRLDRVLYSPMHYPGDYGFIPSTLAEDGDPLDVLVLGGASHFPGVMLRVRPLAYLEMEDEKGEDQKLLAVPCDDPRYTAFDTFEALPGHVLREIEHFFEIYKELEGKAVRIGEWRGLEETHALIRASLENFAGRRPRREVPTHA